MNATIVPLPDYPPSPLLDAPALVIRGETPDYDPDRPPLPEHLSEAWWDVELALGTESSKPASEILADCDPEVLASALADPRVPFGLLVRVGDLELVWGLHECGGVHWRVP